VKISDNLFFACEINTFHITHVESKTLEKFQHKAAGHICPTYFQGAGV
jgi:hypothetical protein